MALREYTPEEITKVEATPSPVGASGLTEYTPDELAHHYTVEDTLNKWKMTPGIEIPPEAGLEVRLHDALIGSPKQQIGVDLAETDFGKNMIESFKQGNDSSHLDILGYSALTGQRDYAAHVAPVEEEFRKRTEENPIAGSNHLTKALYSVSNMIPAMGKGLLEGQVAGMSLATAAAVIPGAQPLVPEAYLMGTTMGAFNYWYKQGAGQLYREMKQKDLPDDVAKPIAHIAGALYGAIEFSQVERIAPGAGTVAKKMITKSITRMAAKMALEYGKDWVHEVGEEGLQEIVTTLAKDIGSNVAKKTNYSVGQITEKALVAGWAAAKSSALPLLLMMAPAAGSTTVKTAKQQAQVNALLKFQEALKSTQEKFDAELKDKAVTEIAKQTEDRGYLEPEEVKQIIADIKTKMMEQKKLEAASEKDAKAKEKEAAGKAKYEAKGKENQAKAAEVKAKEAKVEAPKAAEAKPIEKEKPAAETDPAFDGTQSAREKMDKSIAEVEQAIAEMVQEEADTLQSAFDLTSGGDYYSTPKDDGQGGGANHRRTRLPNAAKHPRTGAKPVNPKQWRELAIHSLEGNRSATNQHTEYRILNNRLSELNAASAKLEAKAGLPISKQEIDTRTGVADVSKAHTLTERTLMQLKLRAESRGAKAGFSAGYDEARQAALEKLNAGKDAREDIKDYIKLMLPKKEWGKFMIPLSKAKNEQDVAEVFLDIESHAENVYQKAVEAQAQNIADRIADSPSVSLDFQKRAKDIMDAYHAAGENAYTTSQLEGMTRKLQIIEKLGRQEFKDSAEAYAAEKKEIFDDLMATAQPLWTEKRKDRAPAGKKTVTQEMMNGIKESVNSIVKLSMHLTPIDGLAIMTGMEKLKAEGDYHFGNYLSHNREAFAQRDALLERLNLDYQNFERIGVYAAREQDGGYEKLANLGVTQEQADAVELTEGEKEYYDFVRQSFDDLHPQVKELMKRLYNRDVGTLKNYVSFISDSDRINELDIKDRLGGFDELAFLEQDREAAAQSKTIKEKSVIARKGAGTQKIMTNIDSIFLRHMDNMAYLLNMAEFTKKNFEVVNKKEMQEKLGGIAGKAWLDWLDLLAKKGGVAGGTQWKLLDTIRQHVGVGMLPFRLSSALIQFSSLPGTVATIGEQWTWHGVTAASHKEGRKFVMDNFPEIAKEIGGDPAFEELNKTIFGGATEVGMWALKKLDGNMRTIAALGAYAKLADEAGIEVDYANPDAKLILAATKLMRESQASSFFIHQPLAISRGNVTGNRSVDKTLLQFGSYNLFAWSNLVNRLYRDGIKQGDIGKTLHAALWLLVIKSVMEMSIRGGTKWMVRAALHQKQYRSKDSFLKQLFQTSVGNIPVLGNIFNAQLYGSNPVPVIAALDKIGDAGLRRLITGKKQATKIKGGIQLAAGLANIVGGAPGTGTIVELLNALTDAVAPSGGSGGFSSRGKGFSGAGKGFSSKGRGFK